jgi:hypothetical protein
MSFNVITTGAHEHRCQPTATGAGHIRIASLSLPQNSFSLSTRHNATLI